MLEAGYILLSVVMGSMIVAGYNFALINSGAPDRERMVNVPRVAVGLLAWGSYVYVSAGTDLLRSFEMPPRFPILLIAPTSLFTGIILYKGRKSAVIAAIPQAWPVYYQSFRIAIESLFAASVTANILHPEVTFLGYNYDIVFAITAPVVGFLVFKAGILPKKLALMWNYFGLAVIAFIIFLFITTIYVPSVWGSDIPLAPIAFIAFPYLLVPAFLMPSAVFMHILSIIQLSK